MTILTDSFVRVIVLSIRRCALYKKILDLLNEESVSGGSSDRAINSKRSPTANFLKGESIAKIRFKIFFGPQTYIYIYYIYEDTNTDHFTLLTLRVRGNENKIKL